jgi:hypothetical protein
LITNSAREVGSVITDGGLGFVDLTREEIRERVD